MPITYKNAIVRVCSSVPFQLTSSTFPQCLRASQIYTSKPELTVFSDNAAFQFAWFWHRTESLCLNQDFQRGGHGAPLSQSMERCGECGGSHLPDRHSEELSTQRAKMHSSHSRWWNQRWQPCRQGGAAELAAFLSKPSFFHQHQPLFCSLSLTAVPFPPPYFHLQSPFSYCFLFPVDSFPLKLTLPCQSSLNSSWKHFSCCFPTLAPVCHPLALWPPPPGHLNISGAETAWSCVHPPLCNAALVLGKFF